MADRKSQEATYKELAGKVSDGRWTDARLADEIAKLKEDAKSPEEKMEDGLKAQASTPPQGNRFAEPQGEARFVPVEDKGPEEFKKGPQDNIKTATKLKEKLFPVKLLKNYRPISEEAQIQDVEGTYRPLSEEEAMKVEAGKHVALPIEEAKSIIAKKIGERADEIA